MSYFRVQKMMLKTGNKLIYLSRVLIISTKEKSKKNWHCHKKQEKSNYIIYLKKNTNSFLFLYHATIPTISAAYFR